MWLSNLLDKDNLKIAARLKYSTLSDEEIIYFGNESEVLSHEYIVKEDLGQLASEISFTYKRLKGDAFLAKEKEADSKNHIELYSNYYAALNTRFKLNLLGLDVTKEENATSITKEEF